MNVALTIDVPEWMFDKLVRIAKLCGESIDHVACSFFAAEVVHTRPAPRTSFCAKGGSHPAP